MLRNWDYPLPRRNVLFPDPLPSNLMLRMICVRSAALTPVEALRPQKSRGPYHFVNYILIQQEQQQQQ